MIFRILLAVAVLVNITFVCRITICIIGPDATLLFLQYIFFLSPEKGADSSISKTPNIIAYAKTE